MVGINIRAKSMFQTGRRERVPSHLFLIVFDAILLANHVTITRSKRENDVMYRSELYFNETHSVYDHLFTSKLFVYSIKRDS